MKLSNLEGTSDEIKNFFQDNGLNAADYFLAPEAPMKLVWLTLPGLCVFLSLSILVLFPNWASELRKFAFVATCFLSIWWAVVLQVRFKNAWATGVVIVGCLLLALVGLGAVTPLQMLDEVKLIKK